MRVLCENIYWGIGEGHDVTALPRNVIVTLNESEINDQEDFWEACENELIRRFQIEPNGFRYEILEGTLQ